MFTINTNWQGVLAELVAPPRIGGFVLAERWMVGQVICPGASEGLLAEQARLALLRAPAARRPSLRMTRSHQGNWKLPEAQKPPGA